MIEAKNNSVVIDGEESMLCQEATNVLRAVKNRLAEKYGHNVANIAMDGILNDASKPSYEANKEADDFAKYAVRCFGKLNIFG